MNSDKLTILEKKSLNGEALTTEEGLAVVNTAATRFFDVLASTERIRSKFKGNEIKLCSITNAKSGLCPEDCTFCAHSSRYGTEIDTFPMVESKRIIDSAMDAARSGAREFSIVTSGTGIERDGEISILADAITGIESRASLESCASLGIVNRKTLQKLREAGLHSYHHNLETARSFFPNICTTHDYDDDLSTVKMAKEMGFHVCCGGIFGLGESWEQRIELAETLRDLDVDSVPINFLDPRPGTPLEGAGSLSPTECLSIIALYRFMLPEKDLVVCGGRHKNLRDLQCLIFAAGANGILIGNYLTTQGRPPEKDIHMLKDLGLTPKE